MSLCSFHVCLLSLKRLDCIGKIGEHLQNGVLSTTKAMAAELGTVQMNPNMLSIEVIQISAELLTLCYSLYQTYNTNKTCGMMLTGTSSWQISRNLIQHLYYILPKCF